MPQLTVDNWEDVNFNPSILYEDQNGVVCDESNIIVQRPSWGWEWRGQLNIREATT